MKGLAKNIMSQDLQAIKTKFQEWYGSHPTDREKVTAFLEDLMDRCSESLGGYSRHSNASEFISARPGGIGQGWVPTNKLIQATKHLLEGTFQSEPNPTLLGIWEILKKEMEDKDNNYQFSGDIVIKKKSPKIKTNDKIDFSKIYDGLYPENSDIAHCIFLGFCDIRDLSYLNPNSFLAIWQNQDSDMSSRARCNWDAFRKFLKATSAQELKNLTSIGSRLEVDRAAIRSKHPRGSREPQHQQYACPSNNSRGSIEPQHQQYACPSNKLAVYIAETFACLANEEPPYAVSKGILLKVNQEQNNIAAVPAGELFSGLFESKKKRFWTLRELLNIQYNRGKLIESLPEEGLSDRARQCLEWEQMASLLSSESFKEWRVAFKNLPQLQKTNLLPVIRQGVQGDQEDLYVHIENFEHLKQIAEGFGNKFSTYRAIQKALEGFVALSGELRER